MELSVDAHRAWAEVPHRIRAGEILPDPWEGLFGTLRSARPAAGCMTIGQIGQRPDGRIATVSGHSRNINGPEGHRHFCLACARLSMPWWSAPIPFGSTATAAHGPPCHRAEPGYAWSSIHAARSPATARPFIRDGVHRIVVTGHMQPSLWRRRRHRDDRLAGHRGPHRTGCDSRRLVRARPAADPDRGRRADGLVLPVGRLPRSPARCRLGPILGSGKRTRSAARRPTWPAPCACRCGPPIVSAAKSSLTAICPPGALLPVGVQDRLASSSLNLSPASDHEGRVAAAGAGSGGQSLRLCSSSAQEPRARLRCEGSDVTGRHQTNLLPGHGPGAAPPVVPITGKPWRSLRRRPSRIPRSEMPGRTGRREPRARRAPSAETLPGLGDPGPAAPHAGRCRRRGARRGWDGDDGRRRWSGARADRRAGPAPRPGCRNPCVAMAPTDIIWHPGPPLPAAEGPRSVPGSTTATPVARHGEALRPADRRSSGWSRRRRRVEASAASLAGLQPPHASPRQPRLAEPRDDGRARPPAGPACRVAADFRQDAEGQAVDDDRMIRRPPPSSCALGNRLLLGVRQRKALTRAREARRPIPVVAVRR